MKDFNRRLKEGTDCGCYRVGAYFDKWAAGVDTVIQPSPTTGNPVSIPVGAMDVKLRVWAKPIKKEGCVGRCTKANLVQVVQSSEKGLTPWQAHRTGDNNWRIDATKKDPDFYVSDSPHGFAYQNTRGPISFGGEVTDTPNARIHEKVFLARTCAICTEGKDSGNILGCVEWGFKATPLGQGKFRVEPKTPKLICGRDGQGAFEDAKKGWNRPIPPNSQ